MMLTGQYAGQTWILQTQTDAAAAGADACALAGCEGGLGPESASLRHNPERGVIALMSPLPGTGPVIGAAPALQWKQKQDRHSQQRSPSKLARCIRRKERRQRARAIER